jgi:hypothetical protein
LRCGDLPPDPQLEHAGTLKLDVVCLPRSTKSGDSVTVTSPDAMATSSSRGRSSNMWGKAARARALHALALW